MTDSGDDTALVVALAALPPEERDAYLRDLSDVEQARIAYDWPLWAHPKQLAPPGDWRVWLYCAGRGAGKTRAGAEWVRDKIEHDQARAVALVAPTAADVRDVIVEGPSGMLAVCPPWARPTYEPSKRKMTWPSGAEAHLYSADEPDRLRGPQHDLAWADEVAAWRRPEAYDMLLMGLRMGADPRLVVTTTPKPTPLMRLLLKDPMVRVTRGNTYENLLNLAPAFVEVIIKKYEGTRLGRQELWAEMLEDVPGALWTLSVIEAARIRPDEVTPDQLRRVVVAVDPPATSDSEESAECGLVVVGITHAGHGVVLEDASRRATPLQWASVAVSLQAAWRADRIVAESNMGGEMVESTLRTVDRRAPIKLVNATRGKLTRAEPIAALYEQGLVHHAGVFPQLEEQMTQWVPGAERSPDRMDALVWGLTEVLLGTAREPVFVR